MLDIDRLLHAERAMHALTGASLEQLQRLEAPFAQELSALQHNKPRQRAPGGGCKHSLTSPRAKLVFMLLYLKCYPTFDLMGALFGVDRSRTCRWVHAWLPALRSALGHEAQLPERKARNMKDLVTRFPEVKLVLLDGTERPVQRAQNREAQRADYSGKKKRHTRKNLVVSDERKRIVFLGETQPGSHHDITLFKASELGDCLPPERPVLADSGFQGLANAYPRLSVFLPYKKSRKGALDERDKAYNRLLARGRVRVENALAGVKRLRCVADVFRNRRPGMDDDLLEAACGIWNLNIA